MMDESSGEEAAAGAARLSRWHSRAGRVYSPPPRCQAALRDSRQEGQTSFFKVFHSQISLL